MTPTILYTNIGRGHPFYLDGVRARWSELPGARPLRVTDVLACSDALARVGWIAVHELYRRGGSPGIGGVLYRAARGERPFDGRSVALGVLGRGIRRRFGADDGPLLVAHPILVAILAGRERLMYQHGEVVVPAQAIVAGASRVYVPTPDAADAFVRGGYPASRVVVTGLCVEPALADRAGGVYEERLSRLRSGAPIVAGFFSSGAEPSRHVEHLALAACSVVRAGGRAIVVAERGGALQRRMREVFAAARLRLDEAARDPGPPDRAERSAEGRPEAFAGGRPEAFAGGRPDEVPEAPAARCPDEVPEASAGGHPGAPAGGRPDDVPEAPGAMLVSFRSREELDVCTAEVFPALDVFVAPPHERTSWALGLGLPMAIVGPDIGPFAPLNRAALSNAGVAIALDAPAAARGLGARLSHARQRGELSRMSERGFGRHTLDGFTTIARDLADA